MEIKFYKKDYLLKQSENTFLHVLKMAIGDEYEIFPQIHMDAFVDTHSDKALWRMVMPFSVDYLLCEKKDFKPILAIELNGHSHDDPTQKEKDLFKRNTLAEIGLPFLEISRNQEDKYDSSEIKLKIKNKVASSNDPQN